MTAVFVPGAHDGMAAFPGEYGTTILVRNHELNGTKNSEVIPRLVNKYDPLSKGGTTTLIVGGDRQLLEHRVSLARYFPQLWWRNHSLGFLDQLRRRYLYSRHE